MLAPLRTDDMSLVLTDAGLETVLLYEEGIDLPHFVWALESHRSPDNTRTALWQRLEEDYLRKLDLAKCELQRLESAGKEKEP